MRQNNQNSERGQALVEAALSMSLYLTFIFATFNLAIVLFMFQSYSDRARHALRVVTVSAYDANTTPTTVQNLILFGETTVPSGTADSSSGYMGLQRSSISVTPSITGSENDRLTVKISNYTYSTFSFGMLGGSVGGTGRDIEISLPYEGPRQ